MRAEAPLAPPPAERTAFESTKHPPARPLPYAFSPEHPCPACPPIDAFDTGNVHLPPHLVHIVLVNGTFIAPEDRATRTLQEGDALAIGPPIAGG